MATPKALVKTTPIPKKEIREFTKEIPKIREEKTTKQIEEKIKQATVNKPIPSVNSHNTNRNAMPPVQKKKSEISIKSEVEIPIKEYTKVNNITPSKSLNDSVTEKKGKFLII